MQTKQPPGQTLEDLVSSLTAEDMAGIMKGIEEHTDIYKNAGHRFRGLMKLFAISDEHMKEDSKGSSCKKGCSFCCNYRIECTEVEAELIVHYCAQNNIPIDKSKLEAVKDLGIEEYMFHPQRRCTFLADDGTCKIYPVRPFSCRTYYVFNDPKECNVDEYPDGFTCSPMKISSAIPQIALMSNSESSSFANSLLKFLK